MVVVFQEALLVAIAVGHSLRVCEQEVRIRRT